MTRRTFMAIAAVIAAVFGLGFITMPAQVMSIYGVGLDAAGQWVGRYLGAAFIGLGVLTWLARESAPGEALRAILFGDLVASVLGLIVAVLDALSGLGNALGWLTVAIYLFLTLGFGYFRFVAPETP